jgi:hypothetical protein
MQNLSHYLLLVSRVRFWHVRINKSFSTVTKSQSWLGVSTPNFPKTPNSDGQTSKKNKTKIGRKFFDDKVRITIVKLQTLMVKNHRMPWLRGKRNSESSRQADKEAANSRAARWQLKLDEYTTQ